MSRMRLALCILAGLLFFGPRAAAIEREPLDVFAGRRAQLLEKLNDGITVVFGYTSEEGESLRTPFRQENSFYYLTGWNEPGAVLLLTPRVQEKASPVAEQVNQMPREILFLPRRDLQEERWTGAKTGPYDADIREKTGFATVEGTELFEKEFSKAITGFGKVYTPKPRPRAADRDPEPERFHSLEKLVPLAEIADARAAIVAMRMVKSPGEIGLIQKATDASVAAHLAAWKRAKPDLYEYQVAATMESVFMDHGCDRPAYAPIVGAGLNSTVLHYAENSHRLDAGQVLLMDVGGEYGHYATDITRTIPVDGRFTPRQREIYEIVLGAQKAAIAAVKPGMMLGRSGGSLSLYQIAYNYINTHGKDREGNPLGKYFIHGLSHHVGLNVHDPMTPDTPLRAGMVITVEPGIYIPEEQIGVRIEDVVLVTESGNKVLSGALPKEPDEVERMMH